MTAHDELARALDWLERQAPQARLVADSRRVRSGDVFVAQPGGRVDGRAFVDVAIASGAIAVLHESAGAELRTPSVPAHGVDGLAAIAGELAARHYGRPGDALTSIGVTGTNGKTTCVSWIAQGLGHVARRCATIGTLGIGFPGELDDTGLTTPDVWRLHEAVRDLARAGAQSLAIEASSIGLDQGRLDGLRFDVAVFTNLTRDHLDYHGGMAAYEAAKARLFQRPGLRAAVVNLDDAAGRRMLSDARAMGARTIGFGIDEPGDSRGRQARADASIVDMSIRAYALETKPAGMAFEVDVSDAGRWTVELPSLGRHNVANWLACLGALIAANVEPDAAVHALLQVEPAEGRLQPVASPRADAAEQPLVVVDYAHTPDALVQALSALRPIATLRGGRLAVVFGCGGDRDKGKRPLMAAAAAAHADYVVLTSDNPRREDPFAILAQTAAGLPAGAPHRIDADRRSAIRTAIGDAAGADVVLIAGKGHERTQEIAGVEHPFHDAQEARAALDLRPAKVATC